MSPELHQQVRRLFDEALDRPKAERLPFLEAACAGQPEVLEAVSRLLAAQVESDSFLESTPPPPPPPPKRIGRYVVTGELGRGAMGIVFEAIDPLIGRSVAVKTIHLQAVANPGEAEFLSDRLFREARSAGSLSHPGIVTIFDVGREADTAFIAMERVEGKSLQELLVSGRKLRIPALRRMREHAMVAVGHLKLLREDAVRGLAVVAFAQHGEEVWHDEQGSRCREQKAADDGARECGVLLFTRTADRHRDHADDHRRGCH